MEPLPLNGVVDGAPLVVPDVEELSADGLLVGVWLGVTVTPKGVVDPDVPGEVLQRKEKINVRDH